MTCQLPKSTHPKCLCKYDKNNSKEMSKVIRDKDDMHIMS